MPLITVRNLSIGYGSHAILENLDFVVNAGDYLCVVGENGAGKTTLARTLLHLQEPLRGYIGFGEGLEKNGIGYLPQQTAAQMDFPASVWEIVLSGCVGRRGLRPFCGREEKRLARRDMKRLGLASLEGKCYRELSGGQRRRVLLARALRAARKALLLDEPVAGLDPKAAALMYDAVRELNRDGMAIIMITHDIQAARRYASHMLHIGADPFYGTREEFALSEAGKSLLSGMDGGGAQCSENW